MAENLNFETVDSFCSSDNPAICDKYGRFYTWAAAMDSVGLWGTNGMGCGYGVLSSNFTGVWSLSRGVAFAFE
jgi:uncharacterized protein (TIGR02145 family)